MEHISQPLYGEDGAFAGRRGSTRDVTESKATEEALQRREQELATLMDNSPDIVVRFDRALRHRYVNAAVERATGRAPGEFPGKTNEELGMPPELCARWNRTLREVLETGEPRNLELPFPAPDGEHFCSLRAVPERGPDGTVESVLCTARDETERREAEARARSLAAGFDQHLPKPVDRRTLQALLAEVS
jgi:PAS domain S-box-containing protein